MGGSLHGTCSDHENWCSAIVMCAQNVCGLQYDNQGYFLMSDATCMSGEPCKCDEPTMMHCDLPGQPLGTGFICHNGTNRCVSSCEVCNYPDCGTGMYYCKEERTCKVIGASCTPPRCSAGLLYCPIEDQCKTPGQTCGCVAGQYYDPAAALCAPCPDGTISVANGTCVACPAGKQSSGMHTLCELCGLGSVSSAGGMCTGCPPAQESNHDHTSCVACAAERYSTGASMCKACGSGREMNAAQTGCDMCSAGTASAGPATRCVACGPGQESDASRALCVSCQIGYVSIGGQMCSACGAGWESNAGRSSCVPCGDGKYSGAPASTCAACLKGTIPNATRTACQRCSPGYVNPNDGATSCAPCAVGQTSNALSTVCETCPFGHYNPSTGGVCAACDPGTDAVPDRTSCRICAAGFANPVAGGNCALCKAGTEATADRKLCAACPERFYNPVAGQGCTKVCPVNTQTNPLRSGCDPCRSGGIAAGQNLWGEYPANNDTLRCYQCPWGMQPATIGIDANLAGFSLPLAAGAHDHCFTITSVWFGSPTANMCNLLVYVDPINPPREVMVQMMDGKTWNQCFAWGENLLVPIAGPAKKISNNRPLAQTIPFGVWARLDFPGNLSAPSFKGINFTIYDGRIAFSTLQCSSPPSLSFAAYMLTGSLQSKITSFGGDWRYLSGDMIKADFAHCDSCNSTSYTPARGGYCIPCPPGTVSSENRTVCVRCPAGFVRSSGAAQCTPCGPGTESSQDGDACVPCSAGYVNAVNGSACLPCAAGTMAPTLGMRSCEVCPSALVAPSPASPMCLSCPPGQESDAAHTACVPCSTGYYTPSSGAVCTICPAGTTGRNDHTACDPCPAGYYNPTPGAMTCSACSEVVSRDRSSCLRCPTGTFHTTEGGDTCFACDPGKEVNADQTACNACLTGYYNPLWNDTCKTCVAGKEVTGGRTACTACASGWYNPTWDGVCAICTAGSEVGNNGTTCTQCADRYYSPTDGTATCLKCGPGTESFDNRTGCLTCPPGQMAFVGKNMWGETVNNARCTMCGPGTFAKTATIPTFPNGGHRLNNLNGPHQQNFTCTANGMSVATSAVISVWVFLSADHPTRELMILWYDDAGSWNHVAHWGEDLLVGTTAGSGTRIGDLPPTGVWTELSIAASAVGMEGKTANGMGFRLYDGRAAFGPTGISGGSTWFSAEPPATSTILTPWPVFTAEDMIGDKSRCEPCPSVGYYTAIPPVSCLACDPGTEVNSNRAQCDLCPAGKFNPVSAGSCGNCPAGHEANATRTGCALCDAGSYNPVAGGTCKVCSAGKEVNGERTACTICPVGHYNPTPGGSCVICEAGKETNAVRTQCTPCREGYVNPLDGAGTCPWCPEDTQSTSDRKNCTACVGDSYRNGEMPRCMSCMSGFVGPKCAINCNRRCGGHGNCSYDAATSNFKCTCEAGYVFLTSSGSSSAWSMTCVPSLAVSISGPSTVGQCDPLQLVGLSNRPRDIP